MVTMNGCLTVRPGVAFPVGQTLGQTASFPQTAPETWCQSRVCDAMRIHTDNTTVLICVHLCSSAAICLFLGRWPHHGMSELCSDAQGGALRRTRIYHVG